MSEFPSEDVRDDFVAKADLLDRRFLQDSHADDQLQPEALVEIPAAGE